MGLIVAVHWWEAAAVHLSLSDCVYFNTLLLVNY